MVLISGDIVSIVYMTRISSSSEVMYGLSRDSGVVVFIDNTLFVFLSLDSSEGTVLFTSLLTCLAASLLWCYFLREDMPFIVIFDKALCVLSVR